MEFRLLGPVEVIAEGKPIELGRRRERGVLAILLLEVGQPVPVDRLIDLLFDDNPPRDPRKAIQIDVSRLRRSLSEVADESDVRLTSDQTGYAIHTALESVDLHRFTALVDDARRADGPTDRARLLHEALDLWRGPALTDLGRTPMAEPLQARLEELCLEATELRVETDLGLGRHAELVAELADLTGRHPTSERLVAARMLALYRTGRKRDALDVYQRTADHLAEELGLDPGPRLREVQLAILRDEADLAAPAPTPAVAPKPAPVRPAQLPADLPAFTGRDDELASLLARCRLPRDSAAICAIDGMAGIGKTSLAVRAAHQLSADYPDGQLFIDLHGFTEGVDPVTPGVALERLLRVLDVPDPQVPPETDDRAALYRSVLADKRVLILLDNAATERQVEPLLPASAGCLALVTSRGRLGALDRSSPLTLEVLPLPDAEALLGRVAGPGRLADEPAALVREVAELCGRLPLAIRIAAARLRTRSAWTLTHLLDRLRDEHRRLAELEAGQRDVASAFHLSYRQLARPQARIFRLLGLHVSSDVDIRAAAALAGCTPREADELLDGLMEVHLLQQYRPDRYRFHDLLRSYANERVREEESRAERDAAVTRLLDHYLVTTATAMDLLYPHESSRRPEIAGRDAEGSTFTDPTSAAGWLDTELDSLLASIQHGPAAYTTALSRHLCRHLHTRGRFADDEALHQRALEAAHQVGDDTSEVRALIGLGRVHDMLGRHGEAADRYQQGLDLARTTGDRLGELDGLIGLGRASHIQGPLAPAADFYQQGLDLARELDDYVGEVAALAGLGHIHSMLGRWDEAGVCFQRGLELARQHGDRISELTKEHGLARLELNRGRHDAAIEHYDRALTMARDVGSAVGELQSLNGLASVYRSQGAAERALRAHREVLDLAREIGDRNYQFEGLLGVGSSICAAGNPTEALPCLREALQLAEDLDQQYDQAAAHDALGEALHRLGDEADARRHWLRAQAIFTELEVPDAERVRHNLSRLDRGART
jgi:DNA-binding SARP family transcriptional activator/tetratricopeptide (TPR) repeat protein